MGSRQFSNPSRPPLISLSSTNPGVATPLVKLTSFVVNVRQDLDLVKVMTTISELHL